MILKRVIAFSAALLLAAMVGGMGLSGPDAASVAGAQSSQHAQEQLSGIFAARYGDTLEEDSGAEHLHGVHKVEYLLTDTRGQETELQMKEEVAESEGATLELVGERVTVEGTNTSGGEVKVEEIQQQPTSNDPTAPRLKSSVPSPGGTMARSASNITMEISEPLDATTLKSPDRKYNNVELFKWNKTRKKWQYVWDTRVSCDATCDTITIDPYPGDPSKPLAAGKYRVKAWRNSGGLKDVSGTTLSWGGNYLVSKSGGYVYWWFKAGS